jgi:hypothetical protein
MRARSQVKTETATLTSWVLVAVSDIEYAGAFKPHLNAPTCHLDNEAVKHGERKFLSTLPKTDTDKFEVHPQDVDEVLCTQNESPPASRPSKPKARPICSSKGTGEMGLPSVDPNTGT